MSVPAWGFVPFYVIGGLGLGLADRSLGGWVQQFGVRPGLATAVSVNLIMPLLAVGLAARGRSVGVAWFGALGMTAGFVVGLAAAHGPAAWWDGLALLRAVRPVQVLACLGYGLLGTVTVLAVRAWSDRGAEGGGAPVGGDG
jgi:hypothetical protein